MNKKKASTRKRHVPKIDQVLAQLRIISEYLSLILKNQTTPPPEIQAKSFISEINIDNIKIKGKIMALSMTDTQQASGKLSFVDKKGSTTDVPDGNVTVSSSDETIAKASYEDASNTITVIAGNAGVATLTISAKDKNGTALPFDDVAVEITAGDAVSGKIEFGDPTEQA